MPDHAQRDLAAQTPTPPPPPGGDVGTDSGVVTSTDGIFHAHGWYHVWSYPSLLPAQVAAVRDVLRQSRDPEAELGAAPIESSEAARALGEQLAAELGETDAVDETLEIGQVTAEIASLLAEEEPSEQLLAALDEDAPAVPEAPFQMTLQERANVQELPDAQLLRLGAARVPANSAREAAAAWLSERRSGAARHRKLTLFVRGMASFKSTRVVTCQFPVRTRLVPKFRLGFDQFGHDQIEQPPLTRDQINRASKANAEIAEAKAKIAQLERRRKQEAEDKSGQKNHADAGDTAEADA